MNYIISILLISLLSCTSKRSTRQDYMAISVIADSSDFHYLHPDAQPIIELLKLKEHKNEAITFRYAMVSDKVLSPVTVLRLPNAHEDKKQNNYIDFSYRGKQVAGFYNDIRTLINRRINDSSSLVRSQCFRAISRELDLLVKQNSKRKILLVYSNCYENSPIASIPSQEGWEQLEERPNEIISLFEKIKLLPNDLSGIKIVFVYQPISIEDDKRYNAIISIYKAMLEKRQAKVIIQAENTFSDSLIDF